MQRKHFLQRLAWMTGGLLLLDRLPAMAAGEAKKIRGRVHANGQGVVGAVVSDGYSLVQTDTKGRYELTPHRDAVAVFICTPAGYEFIQEKGIARHYRLLKDTGKKNIDFKLSPLDMDDQEHQFIIWADPQVKNEKDVEKMMTASVPDVKKLVAAAGAGTLLHGITVGDIVWDEARLYPDYDRAVEKMGIPFFQCLGNHDMDYNKGGDEASDDTFQETYGPTYYSFNRGKAHYVIMDNVRYLGKDREYDGFIQQHQLDWLQKDLALVPEDHLVILCVHIPVHNGVKNNTALYDILAGRKVHIMSGHTHYHRNVVRGDIYEHNHGTVCGAWWTGPICGDGTPCGYGVYKVKGTELEWHYQSTGEAADHQMNIFADPVNGASRQVLVNIWDHDPAWKTECWVDGQLQGALEQITTFDPVAYATLIGPDLPKTRGFAEPRKTEHMFRAFVPATAKEVKIVATSRFGRQYSAVKDLTA